MAMTNVYGTIAQLRVAAGLKDPSNTQFDGALEIAGNSAARMIDAHCGRKEHGFWQDSTVVARTYVADGYCELAVDDISTTTGLVVKLDEDDDGTFETTLTINTDFLVEPRNAALEYPIRPYESLRATGTYSWPHHTSGRPGVQVTAKFGWPAVPHDVLQAWLVQSVQLYKSDAAPFGGLVVGNDGSVIRLGARMHPIAEGLLENYSKARVG